MRGRCCTFNFLVAENDLERVRVERATTSPLFNSSIYLPPELRGANVSQEARVEYYQIFWPYLLDKWKKYGAHKIAFAPENPLGQWRDMIQELYDIELKIPGEKKSKS